LRCFFRFNRVTGNQDRHCSVCVGRGVLPFHPPARNADPTPTWTDPRLAPSKRKLLTRNVDSKGRRGLFADLDPPQTFALRADEILGNERQTVWRSGRALQA
jgi:hypothetical protein